jgi:hypothetical protein
LKEEQASTERSERKYYMATMQPLQEGYRRTEQGEWLIIVNHELNGVTPEMIDWWWDHIDTTERYKRWHPTDHVSFEWLVSPATHGHVGAVQRIVEYLNGIPATPATIEIRWEDSKEADAEYDHVLLATGKGQGETAGLDATLMHEYEAAPFGTRMRSHFHFPAQAPEVIIAALYEHNKQEMQNFTTFLPELYRSAVSG